MVPTSRCPVKQKQQIGIPKGSLFVRFIHDKKSPEFIDTIICESFQVEDRMDRNVFQQIYNLKKGYFKRQATKSYEQRVEVLKDLKA